MEKKVLTVSGYVTKYYFEIGDIVHFFQTPREQYEIVDKACGPDGILMYLLKGNGHRSDSWWDGCLLEK